MVLTALQAGGEGIGAASVADYRGAATAASFGDPQAEFNTLRSDCGVFDLGFRSKISLTGSDRVRWLNGMVTNSIRDLAGGQGGYAFLLNPQGHILGDLFAYNRGESITIDTDRCQSEKILATFDHYIIMDDVEVKTLDDDLTALGVAGPRSRKVLSAAGIELPELTSLALRTVAWKGIECTVVRTEAEAEPAFEVWLAPSDVRQLWSALIEAGGIPVGSEALELHRIASGVPLYGVDIRERDLPQETEQARALNFNKGCYVGQEIVERIRSRGAVHRKFTGFVADGNAAISPGSKIRSADKDVGELTSVACLHSSSGDKTIALGYVRREAGTPGRQLLVGTFPVTAAQLPFDQSVLRQEEIAAEQHPA
jgi:folate-binding protein YgfZ